MFLLRQAFRCHTRSFCKLVKLFSQNPWTPSGLGAFQFGIFFNILFSFSCEICPRTYLFSIHIVLNFSLATLHPYYVPLLCPKYLSKMFFLLVHQVLQSLLLLYFHLFVYKINPHYFQKTCSVGIDSPFAGTC